MYNTESLAKILPSMQGRVQSLSAEVCRTVLDKIYVDIEGFTIDQAERAYIVAQGGAPTYGEIVFSAMEAMVNKLGFGRDDVFYDLGSGVGKLPTWVHLTTDAQKSVGIELSESRYKKSVKVLGRLQDYDLLSEKRVLLFVQDDITQADFRDATIIFMGSTCFSDALLEQLTERFAKLQPGLRVVTLKRLPEYPQLKHVGRDQYPTSWSENTTFHYYELLAAPTLPS